DVTAAVVSFQPTATTFRFPAVCAAAYLTVTDAVFDCGVAYATCTNVTGAVACGTRRGGLNGMRLPLPSPQATMATAASAPKVRGRDELRAETPQVGAHILDPPRTSTSPNGPTLTPSVQLCTSDFWRGGASEGSAPIRQSDCAARQRPGQWESKPTVLEPDHQPQAGPGLVDRAHLVVHQTG